MARYDDDDVDENRPRRRSSKGKTSRKKSRDGGMGAFKWVLAGCGGVALVGVLICAGMVQSVRSWVRKQAEPTVFPEETISYSEARKTFKTRMYKEQPAPQGYDNEVPGENVDVVTYVSGTLNLKAWVDKAVPGAEPKPGVLFLHGGFAFGAGDHEQAQPFRDAGFVVMTPMLRGENGLPGYYSMFYDEVDDVLAAADALSNLPHVDGQKLYVCGHSVGGTLALLAAMSSDKFRAAAGFSGSPDQVKWGRLNADVVPFHPGNQQEFQMRSPLAFPRSFKCPVRVYYGSEEVLFEAPSQRLAELSRAAGLDVEAVKVPGDHFSSVDAAMAQCVQFFKSHP